MNVQSKARKEQGRLRARETGKKLQLKMLKKGTENVRYNNIHLYNFIVRNIFLRSEKNNSASGYRNYVL